MTLDTTVKTKEDLKNLTVPMLAEIPLYIDTSVKRTIKDIIYKRVQDNNKVLVRPGKRDYINEGFRVLRTNVDLMLEQTAGKQVIMFTSFNPGAGKTFSCLNLSAAMAIKSKRVLLVDMDLRKGSLSKALNIKEKGISECLSGKADWHDVIIKHESGLQIIPLGA